MQPAGGRPRWCRVATASACRPASGARAAASGRVLRRARSYRDERCRYLHGIPPTISPALRLGPAPPARAIARRVQPSSVTGASTVTEASAPGRSRLRPLLPLSRSFLHPRALVSALPGNLRAAPGAPSPPRITDVRARVTETTQAGCCEARRNQSVCACVSRSLGDNCARVAVANPPPEGCT